MLSTHVIVERDGVEIADVSCRHEHGRGEDGECAAQLRLVFVRRGAFVRSADGHEVVLDPTTAYWMRPGEEQRYDHPHAGGDDCTSIAFTSEDLLEALADARDRLPHGAVHTTPELDIEHRVLLARAAADDESDGLVESALALAARVLAEQRSARISARTRSGAAGRREALAERVREALAAEPELGLNELARLFSVSPHHLSRSFRAVTGHTVARHRMRLRARAALERLMGGERNLARVAADVGFADQSHLCRVMRSETERTPAALRALVAHASSR